MADSASIIIIALLVLNAAITVAVLVSGRRGRDPELKAIEKRLDESNSAYAEQMKLFFQETRASSDKLEGSQKESIAATAATLSAIRDENIRTLEKIIRETNTLTEEVRRGMDRIREENTQQLEKMRVTVDEKLQTTLETRISKSFEQVTRNLESLYKSIGEMNQLATDVSSLSKMFSNVKARGIWGEIQAESIISDIMAPSQYVRNYSPRKGGVVEFAIRLPGKDEGKDIYLPIDSKFPREDFIRYSEAAESGSEEKIALALKDLRARVVQEARDIRDKYINPPETTDFAILFVPTESLYAELLRMEGFAENLQNQYKVVLSGPTNFAALLNSLQLGFRTLQVEKNTRKIWQLFRDLKTQFYRFGEDLEKTQSAIERAQDRIGSAVRRNNAISTKLDRIELPDEERLEQAEKPELAE